MSDPESIGFMLALGGAIVIAVAVITIVGLAERGLLP